MKRDLNGLGSVHNPRNMHWLASVRLHLAFVGNRPHRLKGSKASLLRLDPKPEAQVLICLGTHAAREELLDRHAEIVSDPL